VHLHPAPPAHLEVVEARRRRVGLGVRPDERAQQGAGGRRRVRGGFGFGGQATPATFQAGRPHHWGREPGEAFRRQAEARRVLKHPSFTFFDHSHNEALLEAAVLTSVPSAFVHRAAPGRQTHVLGILLDRALNGGRKKCFRTNETPAARSLKVRSVLL